MYWSSINDGPNKDFTSQRKQKWSAKGTKINRHKTAEKNPALVTGAYSENAKLFQLFQFQILFLTDNA